MFDSLWDLLTTEEEKNTARLTIEFGMIDYSDGTTGSMWLAHLEYLHDQKEVEAQGFGPTRELAYADLVRMVTIGKLHERQATTLGVTPSIFLENEPF